MRKAQAAMSAGGVEAGAGASGTAALDERDMEPRTPMKRLGSTRKLAAFNSEYAADSA